MNAVDIVILAVLALSVLFGLIRGFVGEVLSLACWIAAFWVAWAFGDRVASFYGTWLHDATAALIAGYVSCFIGVLMVGALAGWVVRRLMAHGGLRGGDRFLGMLFGLARGILLVSFVVLMLEFTAMPRQPAWRQSTLLPAFETGAGWIARRLPPDVTRHLESGGRSLPMLSHAPISALRRGARALAAPAMSGPIPAATSGAATRAPAHDPKRNGVGQ